MPLLARLNPDRPPYLIVELPLDDDAPAPHGRQRRSASRSSRRRETCSPSHPERGDRVIDTEAPLLTTPEKAELYRTALDMLNRSGVPYMVGGTYAFQYYAGIARTTKDFDIFVRAARRAARARRAAARRLQDRDRVHALAGQGAPRRQVHRRHLQLRQRRRRSRRRVVRARGGRGSARRPGQAVPAGGDDLVEGADHGARALRRRRRRAPVPPLQRPAQLGAPGAAVRPATGACCSATSSSSASSIRASAR